MHSAPKTVAGRAAGNIVDLLHFSSLGKMEQIVALSSFLASRCSVLFGDSLPPTLISQRARSIAVTVNTNSCVIGVDLTKLTD